LKKSAESLARKAHSDYFKVNGNSLSCKPNYYSKQRKSEKKFKSKKGCQYHRKVDVLKYYIARVQAEAINKSRKKPSYVPTPKQAI